MQRIQRSVESLKTPVGQFHLIMDKNSVVLFSGFGPRAKVESAYTQKYGEHHVFTTSPPRYQTYVSAYFNGDTDSLSHITSEQHGTPFQENVWRELAQLPHGETISYKELAKRLKRPRAARAIGSACGSNNLILIVPCHRVVHSNGDIGNYANGETIKEKLLRHEKGAL